MGKATTTAANATFYASKGAGLREAAKGLLGQVGKLPINGPQRALLSSMETEKAKLARSVTKTLGNLNDVMNGVPGAKQRMFKEAQIANGLARNFMKNSFKGAASSVGASTVGELPVIGGLYKTVAAWSSGPKQTKAAKRRARERRDMRGFLSGRR